MLHRIRLWLSVLVKSEALESDMDEEMRSHLERATERYMARGLSLRDARLAARREFGDYDGIRDEARAARRGRTTMESLITGLRQTVRRLAHEWRYALSIVLVLAVGIGPTAAISSVVYEVLIRPLDYRAPEQLGLVRIDLGQLRGHPGLSQGEVLDLRRAGIFDHVELETRLDEASLGSEPDLVPLTRLGITPGMLRMLGVTPILGRGFLDEDVPTPPPPGAPRPAAPPAFGTISGRAVSWRAPRCRPAPCSRSRSRRFLRAWCTACRAGTS